VADASHVQKLGVHADDDIGTILGSFDVPGSKVRNHVVLLCCVKS
jgi:hypothetical protein